MEYLPIRTSTLRGDQHVTFDVFILLNQKYILYIRNGDSFEGTRLERLKEKKLKKMYITAETETKYREYLSNNLALAFDKNSKKTSEQKGEIAQGIQQANADEVMENPENERAYNMTKDSTNQYVELLMREDKVIRSVLSIQNNDQNLAHHGVTVSTLAVAMAPKLGIADEKTLKILSLGALLHDMGHTKSKINYAQPLESMTKEELAEYKLHPRIGAELVKDKKHFDQSVINIILQHEEFIDGNGYPSGLRQSQMDKLSVITAVANCYDRFVTFEKLEPKDALKKLTIDRLGRYPLDHINALKQVLKEQGIVG